MEKPADELEFIKNYVSKLQAERGAGGAAGGDGALWLSLL
jgi:hypothetical protein